MKKIQFLALFYFVVGGSIKAQDFGQVFSYDLKQKNVFIDSSQFVEAESNLITLLNLTDMSDVDNGKMEAGDSKTQFKGFTLDQQMKSLEKINFTPLNEFNYDRTLAASYLQNNQIVILAVEKESENVFLHRFYSNGKSIEKNLWYSGDSFVTPRKAIMNEKNIIVSGEISKGIFIEKRSWDGKLIWSKSFQYDQTGQVIALQKHSENEYTLTANIGKPGPMGVVDAKSILIRFNEKGLVSNEQKFNGIDCNLFFLETNCFLVAFKRNENNKPTIGLAKWFFVKNKIEEIAFLETSNLPETVFLGKLELFSYQSQLVLANWSGTPFCAKIDFPLKTKILKVLKPFPFEVTWDAILFKNKLICLYNLPPKTPGDIESLELGLVGLNWAP